jgi:hypothetical protein
VIATNARLADINSEANRQRASQAGRQQAVLARLALAGCKPSGRLPTGTAGSGRCSTASVTQTARWPNSARP